MAVQVEGRLSFSGRLLQFLILMFLFPSSRYDPSKFGWIFFFFFPVLVDVALVTAPGISWRALLHTAATTTEALYVALNLDNSHRELRHARHFRETGW